MHYDILYRMMHPSAAQEKKNPPALTLEMEEQEAPLLEEEEEPDLLPTRAVYMLATRNRHWTEQEIGFVNPDPRVPVREDC